MKKGKGKHQIDFKNYQIQNETIYFLSPGQVHNLSKSKIADCSVIIFNEEIVLNQSKGLDVLKSLNFLFNQSPALKISKTNLERLINVINILEMELAQTIQDKPVLFQAINLFLHQVLSFCQNNNPVKVQPKSIGKDRYFHFLELIENSYTKQHSVQYYANSLNIDPKRLNELTKLISGSNALELIQNRIIIEAKRLLFYSNLSIKEVAHTLGFDDVSYFSKFFYKHVGVRPSSFQQANIELPQKRTFVPFLKKI
ncbi:MAG: helix-turn-helix domain-containing protein [Methylotenera sp.]|nr:helix-turn-helix domain-containing protein [Flavobacterium sp.]